MIHESYHQLFMICEIKHANYLQGLRETQPIIYDLREKTNQLLMSQERKHNIYL